MSKKNTQTHKNGIISVSSIVSDFAHPYGAVYSATKRFNENFSKQIMSYTKNSANLCDLIEYQILKPGAVTTHLNDWKDNCSSSTAEECVQGSLADFGHLEVVYGS